MSCQWTLTEQDLAVCSLFTGLVSAVHASVYPLLPHKRLTSYPANSQHGKTWSTSLSSWPGVLWPHASLPSLNGSLFVCRRFLTLHAFSQGGKQSPGNRLSLQNFFFQRAEVPSINPSDGFEEWSQLPHQPAVHFSRKGRGNLCQGEIRECFLKWPHSSITCVARTEEHLLPGAMAP